MTAAAALKARRNGKLSDKYCLCLFFKRQDIIPVLQKDHTLAGKLCRLFMICLVILYDYSFLLRAVRNELQNPSDNLIQITFIQTPVLNSCHDLLILSAGASRHLKIKACPDAFHTVFDRTPVSYNKPFVSPLVPQDICQKIFIFRAESSVQGIVCTHHSPHLCLLNDFFKCRKIDFMKRSLIHLCVYAHPLGLLVIAGKMLDTGSNSLCLKTFHICRCKFSGKIRILAEVFKVSSAERASLHIDSGTEQHSHIFRLAFSSQALAQFFHYFRVKRCSQCGSAREAD